MKKKTYAERKRDGRACHTVWLSREATAALEALMSQLDATKTEVLERLLTREERLMRLLGAAAPPAAMRRSWERAQGMTRAEPTAPEARAVAEPGSPADLARRVLDKGRRGATIVASGRRVIEGRERR